MTAALPDTEGVSARYADIETWSPIAMVEAMLDNQAAAIAAVRPALPALAAAGEAAAARLRHGGRLAYAGAGTSGRIGVQDGAELPPSFDWPRERLLLLMAGGDTALVQAVENAEDQADQGRLDVAGLGPADVLVGLAASGATPYTLACIQAARTAGVLTIGIANSPGAPLLMAAEHAIVLETGPEPIAGSTRMGAGTAQKAALNLFSTLLMTRLGRVHRGQMVDMLARNDKLRRRAVRMLCGLAQVDAAQAAAALETAGGHVKTAILVLRGMTAAQAAAALASADGHLARVPQSAVAPR